MDGKVLTPRQPEYKCQHPQGGSRDGILALSSHLYSCVAACMPPSHNQCNILKYFFEKFENYKKVFVVQRETIISHVISFI